MILRTLSLLLALTGAAHLLSCSEARVDPCAADADPVAGLSCATAAEPETEEFWTAEAHGDTDAWRSALARCAAPDSDPLPRCRVVRRVRLFIDLEKRVESRSTRRASPARENAPHTLPEHEGWLGLGPWDDAKPPPQADSFEELDRLLGEERETPPPVDP